MPESTPAIVNNYITAQTYATGGAKVSHIQKDVTALTKGGAVVTENRGILQNGKCCWYCLATIIAALAVFCSWYLMMHAALPQKNDDHVELEEDPVSRTGFAGKTYEENAKDELTCPDLPNIPYSTWNCNNSKNVGSKCVINCIQGHVLEKAEDHIECTKEGVWSEPSPKCVCRPGFAGENCEHTTYWSVFKRNIDSNGGLNLNFAGNPITCRNEGSFFKWKWVWKCVCTDVKTGRQARCDNYKSREGACEHTSSALIRSMAGQGLYPKPVDEGSMPKTC